MILADICIGHQPSRAYTQVIVLLIQWAIKSINQHSSVPHSGLVILYPSQGINICVA
jgi:hypothetical protein